MHSDWINEITNRHIVLASTVSNVVRHHILMVSTVTKSKCITAPFVEKIDRFSRFEFECWAVRARLSGAPYDGTKRFWNHTENLVRADCPITIPPFPYAFISSSSGTKLAGEVKLPAQRIPFVCMLCIAIGLMSGDTIPPIRRLVAYVCESLWASVGMARNSEGKNHLPWSWHISLIDSAFSFHRKSRERLSSEKFPQFTCTPLVAMKKK